MKISFFKKFIFLALLLVLTSVSYAQLTPGQKWNEFSGDSLSGFNETEAIQAAVQENLDVNARNTFLYFQKRQFIYEKYNFYNYRNAVNDGLYSFTGSSAFRYLGYQPPMINVAPCVNEGFETGNINGWTASTGTNGNSCNYPPTPIPVTFPNPSFITTSVTPFVDPVFTVIIPPSPIGGSVVAKISDQFTASSNVSKIQQTFPVTSSNFLYKFAYIANMAVANHTCCGPNSLAYFSVKVRDQLGNLLVCPNFTFNSPAQPAVACPGSTNTTWSPNQVVSIAGNTVFAARSNGWQQCAVDLTAFIGTNITIEVFVSDCALGGHWAYVYFDSNCDVINFNVATPSGSVNIPAPNYTVTPIGVCGQNATITAQAGLGPYNWNGPPGSGITNATTQAIVAGTVGQYTLSMFPPGACFPINRFFNLTFAPPTSVTASPSVICSGGGSATLSATGALNYTWNPSGSNTSSIVVNPTVTTVYTLSSQSGTCLGTNTLQLNVSPSPTVSVSNTGTFCSGANATLSASGANTFTWNPGALTSSQIIVSPTVSTVYTVSGTNSVGCIGTTTTNLTLIAAPQITAVVISPASGSVCSGSAISLIGTGAFASNYTWTPGNITGAFVTFTPAATTLYTVVGANANGCLGFTVTPTITVDPGPSLTLTPSSPSICIGGTSTITATSTVATTYTWNPGATNNSFVVVNPTVTTNYTVLGKDPNGCISTTTVQQFVFNNPTITISPSSPTLCSGSSVTLSASGGSGSNYTWTPGPSTGSSVVVSPVTNTTYTVVGLAATGCTAQATVGVTVVANPTISAAVSPTAICSGASATLTATGGSGYTWTPGAATGSSTVVNPTVTTLYTVSGSSLGCSSTSTVNLVVNPVPSLTATASPTAICPLGTATLSALGAPNYTWLPGGSTAANTTVSPAATTVYTLTGATALGCTSTATVQLVVNATPTIVASTSSPTLCSGSSVTLSASGGSGSNYTWTPGPSTGSSVVVSPVTNTTYTVVGLAATGCTAQATVGVTVVANPTISAAVSPTAICSGASATLTATGGSGYTWTPGAATGSSTVVNPTVTTLYTVSGSSLGCSSTSTVNLVVNPVPSLTATASPTAICPLGTATLSALGAPNYTWLPGGSTAANTTVSPAATTVYTLTGATALGCTSTATVQLVVNATPTIVASTSSPTLCSGSSVTLSASGGSGSNYTWTPGPSTGSSVVVSPVTNTTYTVVGLAATGCTAQATVGVTVVANPTISAAVSPTAICSGASATLTATGGSGYTWTPGAATGSSTVVNPTVTTLYTVSGSSLGCSSTSTVNLVVNPVPSLTATASPTAICPLGTATLSALGAPNYTWLPGGSTAANTTVSPAATTVYTLTGATALGCTSTATVQLVVNATPTIVASTSSPTLCSGSSVTLSASGGSGSNYTWTPGPSTGSSVVVSPVTNTTYTVVGLAATGCTAQATVGVTVVANPTISAAVSPTAICSGASATLTATGGSGYTWTPGAATGSSTVVNPTVTTLYTVSGSSLGCSSTSTVNLVVNPVPSLTATASPTAICPLGTATLSALGAPNYTWLPGGSTAANTTVSPAATTVYTLTGATALGCTSTATVQLVVNATPTIVASTSSPTLCSGSSVTLSASGGSGSNYTWTPGPSTGSSVVVSPVTNTTYTVVGLAATGCTAQATVGVTVSALPSLTLSAAPSTICAGGSSTLTALGAPSITWNPGAIAGTTAIVSPTATTIFTVSASSGAGCPGTETLAVVVNTVPTVIISSTSNTICVGNSATLTASGAANFTWLPGGSTATSIVVNPVSSTVYSLSGTNGGTCSANSQFTLAVVPLPSLTLTASNATICSGFTTALIATGATNYTWDPGTITGSNVVVSPTVTTTYTLTGESNGCSTTSTLLITVNPLPTVTANASPTIICVGLTTTLTAGGATSYTWLPGLQTGSSFTDAPLATQIYSVIGLDANNCPNIAAVTVSVLPSPTVIVAASPTAICFGGSTTLTATGANTYTWLPSATNNSSTVETPTVTSTYTVIGDNAGCSQTQTIAITVNALPTITAISNPTVVCAGLGVTLTANGGVSYTWAPIGSTLNPATDNPTVTTTYTVDGLDANGCAGQGTVSVLVNPLPTLSLAATPATICPGATLTLSASGAINYTWTPINTTINPVPVTPTVTTTYTASGEDANGCIGIDSIQVVVVPSPTVLISPLNASVCAGSNVTLTATGATNYTWLPSNGTNSLSIETPTSTTTYTVIGDNGGGCPNSTTVSVFAFSLPTITAVTNPTVVCAGLGVTLTANGGVSYTWAPIGSTLNPATDNPTVTTTYTVDGLDANGCVGQGTVSILVNPLPTLTLAASPATICSGNTSTLTASGAINYTWAPLNSTVNPVPVTPTVTTTYTASGEDANGCIGIDSIQVQVVPVPTVVISPLNLTVCAGSSATLTATGASNYTWLPSGSNNTFIVDNPTVTTTYTVIGDNGGNCPNTQTVDVFVNPLPANVTVACSGTITCATPTVQLFAGSTSSNVGYNWNGPNSYTSAIQNPTLNLQWGDFTVTVTDTITGCSTTATVNVPTDGSIPSVTATSSGSITCAVNSVTLIAINTTTNPGYTWTGPASFTANTQTVTITNPGTYTVIVEDLTSNCKDTALVSVGIHTRVEITASISAATCSNGISLNNGQITLSNFGGFDKYDLNAGSSYTGTATFSLGAANIPTSGIVTSNLANPTNTLAYTIRLFDNQGCIKDTTLILNPVDCVPKVLGIAKSIVSVVTNTSNGTYDVTYNVTLKNTDTAPLNNVSLTENLANTFPFPTAFTVTSGPTVVSLNSSLLANTGFDGLTQTNLIIPAQSTIVPNKTDSIRFTVKVAPNGNFGPFKNVVIGSAKTAFSVTVADTSQTGTKPDPDLDNNPNNNNNPTIVSFTPVRLLGLTKRGYAVPVNNNPRDYKFYYTISVHNLGNDTLRNISITEDLTKAVKSPASYTVISKQASGTLSANVNFDGKTVTEMLNVPISKMRPNATDSIQLVLHVSTDTVRVYVNTASVQATWKNQLSGISDTLRDVSNTGSNPDKDGNYITNEYYDNLPTVIVLDALVYEPMVPNGFSPNGDGNHDVWVLYNIPFGCSVKVDIYNRWGNKVYTNNAYANDWDGTPNVSGTFGKNKLPQGTYYYIITYQGDCSEMTSEQQKPKTGFVELRY